MSNEQTIDRFVRRLIFIALITAALLIAAAPVAAHALLLNSDPADAAVLHDSPKQAILWFSEPILIDFTNVELTDMAGNKIDIGKPRLSATDPAAITVELPTLSAGIYRLNYTTLSAGDIHPTIGSIVFGVQQSAGIEAAAADLAPPPAEVALRWINYGALAALIGSLFAALIILPSAAAPGAGDPHTASRRRLLWLALYSGMAAMAASAALLFVQVWEASGAAGSQAIVEGALRLLTSTDYGQRLIAREALLIAVLIATLLFARRKTFPRPIGAAIIFSLLAVVAFIQAQNSHAAGLEGASLLTIGIDALHLLAISLWAGGLIALAVAVAPLIRKGESESAAARTALSRFGPWAVVGVTITIATGIYNSGQQVASLDALLFTLYGRSLMLKVGLTLFVGVIGLLNSAVLHPGVADALRRALRQPEGWSPFAPHALPRTVIAEAIGVSIVLLLAAAVSATSPARGPQWDPPTQEELSARARFTDKADDLLVTFSVKPNRPGPNFISLGVFNTRRPVPAPFEQITVRLAPPGGQSEIVLTPEPLAEEGKYQIVGEEINTAGEWQVEVRITRPGFSDATVSTPWMVMPAQDVPRRPVVFSNQPLTPILTAVALAFAALAFGGLIWLWFRSRAVNPAPTP